MSDTAASTRIGHVTLSEPLPSSVVEIHSPKGHQKNKGDMLFLSWGLSQQILGRENRGLNNVVQHGTEHFNRGIVRSISNLTPERGALKGASTAGSYYQYRWGR